jgi:hypothetical protein
MGKNSRATNFRLSDEDRSIIRRLRELTGVETAASVVRLSLREMLSVLESKRRLTSPRA